MACSIGAIDQSYMHTEFLHVYIFCHFYIGSATAYPNEAIFCFASLFHYCFYLGNSIFGKLITHYLKLLYNDVILTYSYNNFIHVATIIYNLYI